jgi:hypothetical protein
LWAAGGGAEADADHFLLTTNQQSAYTPISPPDQPVSYSYSTAIITSLINRWQHAADVEEGAEEEEVGEGASSLLS